MNAPKEKGAPRGAITSQSHNGADVPTKQEKRAVTIAAIKADSVLKEAPVWAQNKMPGHSAEPGISPEKLNAAKPILLSVAGTGWSTAMSGDPAAPSISLKVKIDGKFRPMRVWLVQGEDGKGPKKGIVVGITAGRSRTQQDSVSDSSGAPREDVQKRLSDDIAGLPAEEPVDGEGDFDLGESAKPKKTPECKAPKTPKQKAPKPERKASKPKRKAPKAPKGSADEIAECEEAARKEVRKAYDIYTTRNTWNRFDALVENGTVFAIPLRRFRGKMKMKHRVLKLLRDDPELCEAASFGRSVPYLQEWVEQIEHDISPVGEPDSVLPGLEIWYNKKAGFVTRENHGRFTFLNLQQVNDRIRTWVEQEHSTLAADQVNRHVRRIRANIEANRKFAYCGPLAGYPRGVYPQLSKGKDETVIVLNECQLPPLIPDGEPIPETPVTDWLWKSFLIGLDGNDIEYAALLMWAKRALERAYYTRTPEWRKRAEAGEMRSPNHLGVISFVGPPNTGKSVRAEQLAFCLGNRVCDPAGYVTGRNFNGEIPGNEVILFDDSDPPTGHKARKAYCQRIKHIQGSKEIRVELKGVDAMNLNLLHAIIISCNTNEDGLLTVPDLTSDVRERITLLYTPNGDMQYPTHLGINTHDELMDALEAERSAWVSKVLRMDDDERVWHHRWGVAYHSPRVIELIRQSDPMASIVGDIVTHILEKDYFSIPIERTKESITDAMLLEAYDAYLKDNQNISLTTGLVFETKDCMIESNYYASTRTWIGTATALAEALNKSETRVGGTLHPARIGKQLTELVEIGHSQVRQLVTRSNVPLYAILDDPKHASDIMNLNGPEEEDYSL